MYIFPSCSLMLRNSFAADNIEILYWKEERKKSFQQPIPCAAIASRSIAIYKKIIHLFTIQAAVSTPLFSNSMYCKKDNLA